MGERMGLEKIVAGRAFLEGPRWHAGALWVSDMHADEVLKIAPDGTTETVLTVAGQPSGLGWLPNGDMLIVSMTDRKLLRRSGDGQIHLHADMSAFIDRRANDMVVDPSGRAFVGNFGFDFDLGEAPRPTVLLRIDPDGQVSEAADNVLFPNGMVITPDAKTLIVAETFAGQLTGFDIDEAGHLSGRRVWARLPEGAVPDGICLDAGHGVWAASPTTNECLRLMEGGTVTDRISTGEQHAIACMLGGEDGKTLFILTADSTDRDTCRANRSACILKTSVTFPHAGRP